MIGLNIHLKSFLLNPKIASGNDKLRVSVTTLPELNKESFIIQAKQSFCAQHFFTVNISEATEKILFVFRKKGIFEDPIIASTTISSKSLPKLNQIENLEMKTLKIYEPVKNGNKNRQVYGEMQVNFSLTTAFPTFEKKQCNDQSCNLQGYLKVYGYSRIQNENQKKQYNSIFVDENYN